MKKIQVWFPLLLAITLSVGMWMGFELRKNIPENSGFFTIRRHGSLQEVMDLIRNNYVDTLNNDTLTDKAIDVMLQQLDPHSVYIPAVFTEEANEDLKGNFEGIGIEYRIIKDTVHVVSVLEDGPADKAGLEIGDRLLKVGDTPIAGINIGSEDLKKLLKGEQGSTVTVEILRSARKISLPITRGLIPKYAVDASYMINPQTGFIHLNKFSRTTYEEFMKAMEELQKKGMKKLILDLRGNGGGILDEAVDIADEFLDDSKLVVYTQGAHSVRRDYTCKRPGLFENGSLVLLVDEFSASASEVLAGALQDWDRATLVGRRTFGKGLVQEPFELSNGSQLRLTVARYYTPSGRNIQKPFSNGFRKYNEEVYDRFHYGSSLQADTSRPGNFYYTKIKKRPVFGGGGITPDIVVPFDTTRFTGNISSLFADQVFGNFIYEYYLSNQSYFKSFKNPAEMTASFRPAPAAWKRLGEMAMEDSVSLEKITPRDREELEKRMKSWMARQIWRMEGFYEVNNFYDETVKKALEILK